VQVPDDFSIGERQQETERTEGLENRHYQLNRKSQETSKAVSHGTVLLRLAPPFCSDDI